MKELDFLKQQSFTVIGNPEVLIRTPFFYQDGEMLDIYVYKKADNILTFSDHGMLFFAKNSIAIDNSWNDKTSYSMNQILIKYEVCQEKGEFYKKVNSDLYATEYEFIRYVKCLICLMNLLEI
jgi:hypothetical protein